MHDVFVSYKSEDSALAMKVVNTLEDNGISCWIAERDIQTGSNYAADIPAAIRETRFFLLLLTEQAQRSPWIMKELDTAITKKKRIFPLMVENFSINEGLNFMLSGIQFYDAANDLDEAIRMLIGQIRSAEESGTMDISPKVGANKPIAGLSKWLFSVGIAALAGILGISIWCSNQETLPEDNHSSTGPAISQTDSADTVETQEPTESQPTTETTVETYGSTETTKPTAMNDAAVMIQPEYVDGSDPTNHPFWGQNQYRRKEVRTIRFQNNLEGVPQDAIDVSERHDRSVLMWMVDGNLTVAAGGPIAPNTNASWMFSYFSNLESIDFGEGFDTSEVTTMRGMFIDCGQLRELDLSGFDTHKVQDMAMMFAGCNSLEKLEISSFRTVKVTDMSNLFNSCNGLVELDLTHFDTSRVTTMSRMFAYCQYLESVNLSGLNTENVHTMDYMFAWCSSLSQLDLTNFCAEKAADLSSMFSYCKMLTDTGLKCDDERIRFAFSLK